MGRVNDFRRIQGALADRTVFQGYKTEREDKTFLREHKKRGNEADMDSAYSLAVVLSSKGTDKKHGDVIYQFYFRY
jgi:hypothetical protein